MLELVATVARPRMSTFEAPKVDVRLTNRGSSDRVLPGPNDQTDALSFDFYDERGVRVRRANGFTEQSMRTRSRLDDRPDLDVLVAGGSWTWTADLAGYHYPLDAGRYELELVYADPEGAEVRSPRVPLEVERARLRAVDAMQDNPVMEGISLLLQTESGTQRRTFVRQHPGGRPLAAWYCEPVAVGEAPDCAFLAATNFFSTDSFDPAFRKWVVWSAAGRLHAQRTTWGVADGPPRAAPLPEAGRLLPSAICTESEELLVFFRHPSGRIDAHALGDDTLELRWSFDGPPGGPPPAIRGDCDFVHVAFGWRGILHLRLHYDGAVQNRRQLFQSRLPATRVEIDPARKLVKGTFLDGRDPKGATLVAAQPDRREPAVLHRERLGLRAPLVELAWDWDGRDGFHQLLSTGAGALYYARNDAAPKRIATGPGPFHPRVVFKGRPYLGFDDPERGFRFYEYTPARFGPHLHREGTVP